MRGEQNRRALRRQFGEDAVKIGARSGIQAGGRLVQQKDFRLAEQGLCQREALPHPFGIGADALARRFQYAHPREQVAVARI